MRVDVHPGAREELRELGKCSVAEHVAMLNAIRILQAGGPHLPYPHSSAVRGTKLRELRPRAGRSPWRAFYCRVGDALMLLAIGPEAQHDQRGFDAAKACALSRLEGL